MKQKKTMIIFAVIVLVIIGIISLGTVLFVSRSDKYIKSAEQGDISRYEWMEMLCEQNGLTEYKNTVPYYKDVDAASPYFPYIQSAAEWDVLPDMDKFEGDGYASGRFVAITAIKSIGERKLMMYLDQDEVIADDTCLELAMEHGLIEKDKLAEGVSEEECVQILETLQDLYFSEFWRDDYDHVVYQDGVRELSPDEVTQSDADGTKIVVSNYVYDTLETGDIIVYEETNTKLKYARKINKKSPEGTLSLSPVELEQAVKSFTVSDITEVTFEDIVNSYASGGNAYSLDRRTDARVMDTSVFSGRMQSEGFKIELSTEENDDEKYLEVKITNHATKESLTVPLSLEEDTVELEDDYYVEYDIDKILIGAQADFKALHGGLQYAEVAVDIQSKFRSGIKAEKEMKVPLYKTPIPLPLVSGCAGLNIQFYLVLSIEGTMSIEAELPVGVSVIVEKDKGIRRQQHELEPGSPKIEANCDAGIGVRFEPVLVVLGEDIIDVEADVGAQASAKIMTWSNLQICADTAIDFPIFTVAVCSDDDVDTLIGSMGWSAEWEILTSENAPVHINTHFEILPDKTAQFVDACTYKEGENDKVAQGTEKTGEQPEDDSTYTYFTQNSDTNFAFDYPYGWWFDAEESRELSGGFKEAVVFKNDRGVLLQYWEQENNDPLGGAGHFLSGVEVMKAGDSLIEGFIVGKIKSTSVVDYPSGEEIPLEDGAEMYAVMPKAEVGNHYYGGAYFADYLSFIYRDSTYYFSASAPGDEKFTEEEEKEVIAILSSFREVP